MGALDYLLEVKGRKVTGQEIERAQKHRSRLRAEAGGAGHAVRMLHLCRDLRPETPAAVGQRTAGT
eukprot:1233563-Pyramimonas_sp.AAC.1